MQLGEHTQNAAISIPPADVVLKLTVGDFQRNGEMGIGGSVGRGVDRERVFDYHFVETVTFYFI